MAKVRSEKPLARRQVIKARRLIHYRGGKGNTVYASKWPRARGKPKKAGQLAWIEHFVTYARYTKQPDPCAVANAADLAPTTGFWPRDILHYAGNGKFIYHAGSRGLNPPTPVLFKYPPNRQYEGAPRVITPTTDLTRVANVTAGAGATQLIPTSKRWDNNAFWSATLNPERITFKSTGLFLVTLEVEGYNPLASTRFQIEIRRNGLTRIAGDSGDSTTSFAGYARISQPMLFEAGEWIDARLFALPTGAFYKLNTWSALGITPESII